MKMKTLAFISTAVSLVAVTSVQADTIASYSFEDIYTSSDTEANSIASAVTGGSGLTPQTPVFSGTGNPGKSLAAQDQRANDEAGAVSGDDYLEFTLTPSGGYELNLTQLSVDLQRSNINGSATDWFLRSSLDSYAATITGSAVSPTTTFATYTVDLSGATFQGVDSAVTFRLYGYGANTDTASLRHDNLIVTGSVTVIPEPGTYALIAGCFAFLWIAGTQRRKR